MSEATDSKSERPTVAKVIRDGKVAVLVSPGFGAGWSTFAEDADVEAALFAPDVVEWVENGKPAVNLDEMFGHYGLVRGLLDVVIEWVPVGDRFSVDEIDGDETLFVFQYDGSEGPTAVGPEYGFRA